MSPGDDATRNACRYLLDRHVEEGRGERVALRADERHLTYEQVWTEVARAAGMFATKGVARGDRVVLLLPDSPAFVTAFFALLRIGAVPVPLNERLPANELARIFEQCRPRGVLVSSIDASRAAEVASHVAPGSSWVVDGPDVELPSGARSFDADVRAAAPWGAVSTVRDEDVAVILYTSGTTGNPKGAVHVHRGLRGTHRGSFDPPVAVSQDDICFSTAPLSFAYGLHCLLHSLAVGAQVVLNTGPRLPQVIFKRIQVQAPTVFLSTPAVYASLLEVAEAQPDIDLPSLRLAISSGETLPERLYERWKRRFQLGLVDVIGSTETLGQFLVADPLRDTPNAGLRPPAGCEVELRDEHGLHAPEREAGQLFVRTPSDATRYWENERETASAMPEGWIRTGNFAARNGSGEYRLLGRSDDIAKIHGQKVVAGGIERCLRSHDAVVEAALAIVPGPDELPTTVAFVEADTRRGGTADLPRELRKHCKKQLTPHEVPARVVIVDALPRTPTGKIARVKLRDAATDLVRPAESHVC